MDILSQAEGFEWDEANFHKNWERHEVAHYECEEIFFNGPLIVVPDEKHSQQEKRYYALGKTNWDRSLFVVFTMRGKKIRVISARDMNKNERRFYK
ncbi:BrnT family toxin [Candidatus Saganbacteria bacterium]|nr:BrnT family toxin [Candidatus Saganbacteria bacterium]